jgi:riboflavin kinase/FMN adenylyltransferase
MQPVTLSGVTVPYKGNGRKLGYPTANLSVATDLADGVYFGFADLGELKDQPAMIFIGVPVTVGDTERRVEAHLLDVSDKDYYGQTMTLRIGHYLRPNRSFENVEQLIEAIKADETAARQWFKEIN